MQENKTSQEIQSNKTKSRAKYDCPPVLETLIYWANYILPDHPLPSIDDFQEIALQKWLDKWIAEGLSDSLEEDDKDNRKKTMQELRDSEIGQKYKKLLGVMTITALESLGKEAEQFEFSDFLLMPDVIDAFISIYTNWNTDFSNLTTIAREIDSMRKGKQEKLNLGKFWIPVFPNITNDKKLKIEPNTSLLDALNGIEADRLRICTICNKIFWAKNKNSETCSKTCLNALRQRRHREKNKEEINLKRRENYRLKKKLRQIKENKNGTL